MKTEVQLVPVPAVKSPSTYVGYRNFYGSGKQKFYIYPGKGWDTKKWGRKPFLGTVYADEEFYAIREAYSKGLVPVNSTFELEAVSEKHDPDQPVSRRYNGS